jgi:cellulose synthase/poly-beta-1,6-N-acetylglucosamine synthase-like glycosyltransferase/spore germination protein YaaH/peptidoglycan/xylan/chitin deacetylase (PgdA/CDA1 family)
MAHPSDRQIFQTDRATRWNRFRWTSRAVILLGLLGVVAVFWGLLRSQEPDLPDLPSFRQALTDPKSALAKNSPLARKYKSYRQLINQKQVTLRREEAARQKTAVAAPSVTQLHAAFYVDWDATHSFPALKKHVGDLNLVIPTWLYIDPSADTLVSHIDPKALALMRGANVPVMPMVSNAFNGKFHGDAVHRIITDRVKKERFITQLIQVLQNGHFAGANIDFEELQEKENEPLALFQKELYIRLHAAGLLLSQDVVPFNQDYNYELLGRYNDYVFVMAYDQYNRSTAAGPVAHQKWIEAAVEDATKKLPPSKTILALAAYGYDWPREENKIEDVSILSYGDALALAREAQTTPHFDNDSYNLTFSYYDETNTIHDVFFTDAATTFNAQRFATEIGLAGTAIWRLGSEDPRTWLFYGKELTREGARNFDWDAMQLERSTDNISYQGHGEVLDILATPETGTIKLETDTTDGLISEETYTRLPTSFIGKKYGWNGAERQRNSKKIILTFDDGPDPRWTPRVLDILAQEHVPATFFIVGLNAENNIPIVKRIYREGHEIGNHTFTHPDISKVSSRRAVIEMESTRLLLECITGHSTVLFRAPFNADFTPEKEEELLPVAIARTHHYIDVGESLDPEDWEPGINADTILNRIIARKNEFELHPDITGGNIILLHDAGGDSREATVRALPAIIRYYKSRGYSFTTVADYLGKKKEDLMPPVPRGSGFWLIQANYGMALAAYWLGRVLFGLFLVFMALSLIRVATMVWLTIRERKLERASIFAVPGAQSYPLVAVIVPAYNEEVNAVKSLHQLLQTDYPNLHIIFVDDGSTDRTYELVAAAFANHPKLRVFKKQNGGKASALNFGIAQTEAEIFVCIDADTRLQADAVRLLVRHFGATPLSLPPGGAARGEVGAVAGNVKVGNERNMLTRWQAIEYISSQNFDRRAFASVNAITVVPGAIGAFRREALVAAGGFTTDTLAEDCDLTIRILRAGFTVQHENEALAFTEAPETLRSFLKQRFRWTFGVLQTSWKHRDLLFSTRHRGLGWLAMPNILLFQYIIPAFIPLADLFLALGLLSGNGSRILPYYMAFLILEAAVALLAFRMEGERPLRLLWLLPQRLIYRWLMWWVLFKTMRRAVKGELQQWGVLKRTGNITGMPRRLTPAKPQESPF